MRNIHFSRIPKIAAFLKDYGYGKEFLEKFPESSLKKVAMIKEDPSVTTDEMARLTRLARRSVTNN